MYRDIRFLKMWAFIELLGMTVGYAGLYTGTDAAVAAAGGVLFTQVLFSALMGLITLRNTAALTLLLTAVSIYYPTPWYYGTVLALCILASLPAPQNLLLLVMKTDQIHNRVSHE